MVPSGLREYFNRTPALARLCRQNGWPDPETLSIEVLERTAGQVVCSVSFEEVAMEGAGCVAGRIPCWGRYRVQLDAQGDVERAELIAGARDD